MSADANQATIERLYEALGQRNGGAMTACYAPDAHFRDPAFGDLEGEGVGAMWRMLTGRAADLEIELRERPIRAADLLHTRVGPKSDARSGTWSGAR